MRKVGRTLLVGLVACVCATVVSSAHAAIQTIPGSAPNMTIHIDDTGRLQGVLPGQSLGMFFPPSSQTGSNSFYLRVKNGTHANTTFRSGSGFTPVSNGPVTGNWTPPSPAQNVTVYDVGPGDGPAIARVTQTTLYTGFQKRFNVIYEVTNTSGTQLQFIAGTAADLYIGGNDSGTGIFIDGPQRFVGGTNAASLKVGGLREQTFSRKPGEPANVPVPRWASYAEGNWSTMLNQLVNNDAFPNTIVSTLIDNGVGASWNDHATTALLPGATARYEVQWVAEQTVPLTASPAQASRELPGRHDVVLTLSDASGAPVPNMPIRYRIDGVNAFPVDPSQYLRGVTDAAGHVVVPITGTTPGQDTVLAFADVIGAENGVREADEPQASAKVTWLADNHVDGPPTAPSSLGGPSGSLPVGVVANPDNPEAPTYTFGQLASQSAGFETCTFNGQQGRRLNFPISVALQPGGGTIDSAQLLVVDRGAHDPNATSGSTAPPVIGPSSSSGNTRGFVVECVTNADLWVRFTITEGGDTQTFVIPIGGLLLIDPQGVVYDRAAYDAAIAAGRSPEQARAQAAIRGATVRLQRRNTLGQFVNVISGDPGIRPNVNPQTTGADGIYQWDVSEGTYRVVVDADGYLRHESRSVDIPPPVLDLHIPMERPASPTAAAKPRVPGRFRLKLPKAKKKVKLSKKGVLSLGSVTCPSTVLSCPKAKLTLRPVTRGKGKRRLPKTLATKTFAVKRGKTVKLKLKLGKKLTASIRARGAVAVKLTVSGKGVKAKTVTIRLVRG